MTGLAGMWARGAGRAEQRQLRRMLAALAGEGDEREHAPACARLDRGALLLGTLGGAIGRDPRGEVACAHDGRLLEPRGEDALAARWADARERGLGDAGELALAIFDARSGELVLVRDAAGVRAIFYARHRGALVFASEAKAIRALDGFPRELDPAWSAGAGIRIAESARTPFRGIAQVRPGHLLRVTRDGARQERWAPELPRPDDADERELASSLRAALARAIDRRLVPGAAVAIEGGLASQALSGLVGARARPIAIGPWCDAPEAAPRIVVGPGEIAAALLEGAHAAEGSSDAIATATRLATLRAARAAGARAILGTDGGAELLSGPWPHAASFGSPDEHRARARRAAGAMRWAYARGWLEQIDARAAEEAADDACGADADVPAVARRMLGALVLPSLGARVERAAGVAVARPFLDRAVASLALGPRDRAHAIARRALADVLPPWEIAAPEPAPPLAALARTAEGRDVVEPLLDDRAIRRAGIFDPLFVRGLRAAWRAWPEASPRFAPIDRTLAWIVGTQALHAVHVEDALGRAIPRDDDGLRARIDAARATLA